MCKRSGGQQKSAEVHISSISVHSLQRRPIFSICAFRFHHIQIKQKSKMKRLALLLSNASLLSIRKRLHTKILNAFSCILPWSLTYYAGAGISPSPHSDSVLPPPSPQWGHERAAVAHNSASTWVQPDWDQGSWRWELWTLRHSSVLAGGLQPGWVLLCPTCHPSTFVMVLQLGTHLPFC